MAIARACSDAFYQKIDELIPFVTDASHPDMKLVLQTMLDPQCHQPNKNQIQHLIEIKFSNQEVSKNLLEIFEALHAVFKENPALHCMSGHPYYDAVFNLTNNLLTKKSELDKKAIDNVFEYCDVMEELKKVALLSGVWVKELDLNQEIKPKDLEHIKIICIEWFNQLGKSGIALLRRICFASHVAKKYEDPRGAELNLLTDEIFKALIQTCQSIYALLNWPELREEMTVAERKELFSNFLCFHEPLKQLLSKELGNLKLTFYGLNVIPKLKIRLINLWIRHQTLDEIKPDFQKRLEVNIAASTLDYVVLQKDLRWFEKLFRIYHSGLINCKGSHSGSSLLSFHDVIRFLNIRCGAIRRQFYAYCMSHESTQERPAFINLLTFFHLIKATLEEEKSYSMIISLLFYLRESEKFTQMSGFKLSTEPDLNPLICYNIEKMIRELINVCSMKFIHDNPSYRLADDKGKEKISNYYHHILIREVLDSIGFLLPKLYAYGKTDPVTNVTYQFIHGFLNLVEKGDTRNPNIVSDLEKDFDGLYDRLINARLILDTRIKEDSEELQKLGSDFNIVPAVPVITIDDLIKREKEAELMFVKLCNEFESETRIAEDKRQRELKKHKEKFKDSSTKNRSRARALLEKKSLDSAPLLCESQRLYDSARNYLKIDSEKAKDEYIACINKSKEENNLIYVAAACLELSEIFSLKAHAATPDFSGQGNSEKNTQLALSFYKQCVMYAELALQFFKDNILDNEQFQENSIRNEKIEELSTAIHLCLTRAGRELQQFIVKHNQRKVENEERLKSLLLEREQIRASLGLRWFHNSNPKNTHFYERLHISNQIDISSDFNAQAEPFFKEIFHPINKAWALVAGKEVAFKLENEQPIISVEDEPFLNRLARATNREIPQLKDSSVSSGSVLRP